MPHAAGGRRDLGRGRDPVRREPARGVDTAPDRASLRAREAGPRPVVRRSRASEDPLRRRATGRVRGAAAAAAGRGARSRGRHPRTGCCGAGGCGAGGCGADACGRARSPRTCRSRQIRSLRTPTPRTGSRCRGAPGPLRRAVILVRLTLRATILFTCNPPQADRLRGARLLRQQTPFPLARRSTLGRHVQDSARVPAAAHPRLVHLHGAGADEVRPELAVTQPEAYAAFSSVRDCSSCRMWLRVTTPSSRPSATTGS